VQDSRNIRLKQELTNYSYRRLTAHLLRSKKPERVLNTAGRRWLISKIGQYGYGSVILKDLYQVAQQIVEHGDSEKQFVDLVDIALWKLNITSEQIKPFFGMEQAVRARTSEYQKAVNEVEGFGTADDQIIVHAEIALQKKINPDQAKTHLDIVRKLAKNVFNSAITEYVAVRLAPTYPDVSFELAQTIPVPLQRFDSHLREDPTYGRCLSRIFASLAKKNVYQSKQFQQNMPGPNERLYAGLGIMQTILEDASSDLKDHIKGLLNDAKACNEATSIAEYLGAFVIRQGANLPTMQYLSILDDL